MITSSCGLMPAILSVFVLVTVACSGGTSSLGGSDNGNDNNNGTPDPVVILDLDLERKPTVPGLDRVSVLISLTVDGQPGAETPEVSVDRGVLGTVQATGAGSWTVELEPAGTGVHEVTVTAAGATARIRPLVCAAVHEDWGQPRLVEGLVNTAGLEDGAHISADGEWMTVQYGPIYMSGLQIHFGDTTHPLNTTAIGPIDAPERPGFFTTRIEDGVIDHYLVLYPEFGPFFSPPTLFYGFRRQADGSFAEPFLVALDDGQGANLNPFGLQLIPNGDGGALALFAFDNPYDGSDTSHDIWYATIEPGAESIMARWYRDEHGIQQDFANIGVYNLDARTLSIGNPHLHMSDGGPHSLWTDAEFLNPNGDTEWQGQAFYESISVHIPPAHPLEGDWQTIVLPAPINSASARQFQPCFDGSHLYFGYFEGDQAVQIHRSAWNGGPFGGSDSWSEPVSMIDPRLPGDLGPGALLAVGEPTIAHRGDAQELYFVALISRGLIAPDDDLDMDGQVAMVPSRATIDN